MKTIIFILFVFFIVNQGCKTSAGLVKVETGQIAGKNESEQEWKREYNVVMGRLQNCQQQVDSNTCKSIQYYQLGFLFEHAIDTTNKGLLDSAEHYYQKNLQLFSGDRATRDRLLVIYEKQGRLKEAESLLHKLYEEFPDQRLEYALQLSKNYTLQEDDMKAYAWAKKCTEIDPYREASWKNLVMTMEPNSIDFNEVEELSYKALNYGFINQSLQIIELYINNHFEEERLNKPLIHWCNILFDTQSDYESRFHRLPAYERWTNHGLKQLKDLFNLEEEGELSFARLQELDFWYNKDNTDSPNGPIFNYEIVLKYLDQSAKSLMYSDRVSAIKHYELGLKVVEELDIQSYELTGTYFNLASSLADIYLLYPELDPSNEKISELTNNLFSGKGLAYRDNNREIIKRFHITLGMIYAQQNVWTEGWATNARFQLEHALDNKENDEYMPLVHQLLGNGYLHYLPNRKQKAFDHYLKAAQAYLNLDALSNTQMVFDTLNTYKAELDMDKVHLMNELKKVHEIRNQGRNLQSNVLDGNYIKFSEDQASKIRSLDLESSFKRIQMFKIYAELGQQLDDKKNEQLYCYSKALDIVKTLDHVPSYNDLIKIEKIAMLLHNQLETSKESFTLLCKNVSSRSYGISKGSGEKITYNSPEEQQVALYVDLDLFEISKLLIYFNRENSEDLKPKISYFNQQIVLQFPDSDNVEIDEIPKELMEESRMNNLKIRKKY